MNPMNASDNSQSGLSFTNFKLSLAVFAFVFLMLTLVQLKIQHPILLVERIIHGGGWVEIFILACYGSFVTYKMQNPGNVPKWRRITWTLFSVVFFSQLIFGLSGIQECLMTGKLHLPVPAMILAGPLYRGQLSVMTVLFLSTIVLTGPAWCSQLCYFGAFDNLASNKKTKPGVLKHKKALKSTILLLIITGTLLLRWLKASITTAALGGILIGLVGIAVMILFSRKKGKMIHCILYCPIGTLVNLFKVANPFRIYIDNSCSLCMKCTTFCKYDALNPLDIRNKKPSFSCTLCGDCLAACHDKSIKYKFLNLSPQASRNLYLFLTISLHAIFMGMARI